MPDFAFQSPDGAQYTPKADGPAAPDPGRSAPADGGPEKAHVDPATRAPAVVPDDPTDPLHPGQIARHHLTAMEAVWAAQRLKRVARHPYSDAAWPAIRDRLREIEAENVRLLELNAARCRADNQDEAVATWARLGATLDHIRAALGQHPHPHPGSPA